MGDLYVLDGHVPVAVEDVLAWGAWFDESNEERRVALTYFDQDTPREVQVSTVFLGIDYNFSPNGLPLVFETMVFGGDYDQYTDRYTTWDEAEEGHARIVADIRDKTHPHTTKTEMPNTDPDEEIHV